MNISSDLLLQSMARAASLLSLAVLPCVLLACASLDSDSGGGETAEETFEKVVKPLFEHRCVWCHSDRSPGGGLNLQDRESVYGSELSFVIAGNPRKSRLITAIDRHPKDLKSMPADGWKITREQEQALRRWIAGGAPWPEGKEGEIKRKNYRVDLDDYL